jgi:cell division protein ftsZ
LDSPLLNDNKIIGAKDVLLLILSGSEENQEATMDEIGFINDYVQKEAGGSNSANVIFGVGTEEDLGDAIKVLVIATGFAPEHQKKAKTKEEEPKRVTISLDEDVTYQPKVKAVTESSIQQVNTAENTHKNDVGVGKRVFRLEDNDEVKPNIPTNTFAMMKGEKVETLVLEEEQVGFSFENSEEEFIKEEEPNTTHDLFSYNELDAVSYTFDLDTDEKETPKSDFQNEEKKSQGFDFRDNRKDVETPVFVKHEHEEEMTEFKILTKEESVGTQNQEPIVEKKQEKPIFEIEQKEEFTIIEKKIAENPKVLERRNKLREFNSRYQASENENTFETVPAFKRRNVSLDLENTSEHNISSFYAERNGKVEIRENKYLNKDVD